VHDALLASLDSVGHVDVEDIADRIGLSAADAIAALGTAVYEDPAAGWQTADEYLSGNVVQKLEEAASIAASGDA
jgi:N12 class adenine-specific DNA methylase